MSENYDFDNDLLFFCHCFNEYSYSSHIDYDSGLFVFDDGMCDFDANGFDCRDCSRDCVKRLNFD